MEVVDKKLEAKEKRKIYMREYMRKRKENDTEFKEKQNELCRMYAIKKYTENEEYRKIKNKKDSERYQKYRDAFLKSQTKESE